MVENFDKIQKILEEDEETFDRFLTSSKKDAQYLIHPGKHDEPTKVTTELLNNFDAVVLEAAGKPYEQLEINDLKTQEQYEQILNKNTEEPENPLFILDSPLEKPRNISMDAEAIFYTFILTPLCGLGSLATPEAAIGALPGLSYASTAFNYSEKTSPYHQLSLAPTSFGFRSALTAEKLEKLPNILEEDKPDILVDYGAAHSDIKTYLDFPKLGKLTKKLHSLHGYGKRDQEKFDKALEFKYREKSYQNSNTEKLKNYYKKSIREI